MIIVIGSVFLLVSALCIWITTPIRGPVADLYLSWIALILGGIGGVAWWYRWSRVLAIVGVAGLGLCSVFISSLVLLNPGFWALVDDNAQYAQIVQFSRRYLPANFGIEPTFQIDLLTETIFDRLVTAVYFMSWGWWLCLLGSLLLLGGCFWASRETTLRWSVITGIVLCIGQGVILGNGVVAQYYQDQGDYSLARGRYTEALEHYAKAQRFDPQLRDSPQMHRRLGEAYYYVYGAAHPYGRLYLGNRSVEDRNFEAALSEYLLAAQEASAFLQQFLPKRIAWIYTQLGLTQYDQGKIGEATAQWEKALTFHPDQIPAVYFLTRAYFDQGDYGQSIAMGRLLLTRSQNRLLNANIQANIGDSYWKLNDFMNARQSYEASLQLDSYANYRIFKSLGGT